MMKRNIRILLIFILVISNYSTLFSRLQGQSKVDSLLKELSTAKSDTNEVNLLKQLSFDHYAINPDLGIEYGKQGLELANKLKWKEGIAKCNNAIGVNFWAKSDFEKALTFYKKALSINEELGDKNGVARDYGNIGIVYSNLSDYPKALKYYKKALGMYRELANVKSIARNLGNIGIVYVNLADYPKAIEYYQKALKKFEEIDNKNGIATNLSNIGIVYRKLSDYDKALEYYRKALKINEELGSNHNIASNLSNIGLEYMYLSEYDMALDYFQKALKLNKELGNKRAIATNLGSIGIVNSKLFDYSKSLQYYRKALKINEELGDKSGIATYFGNIGGLYYSLTQDSILSQIEGKSFEMSLNRNTNLAKSISYTLKAVEIAEEIGAKNSLIFHYNTLQQAYNDKGEYKNAYKYLLKQKTVHDTIFTADKQKVIDQMTEKYELEQREKEEALAAAKKAEEKRYTDTLQYVGISLLIVILAITIFIVRRSNIRVGFAEASVFFTFLLFYEFITVLIEPWADGFTNQEPLYKLGINIMIALLLIPLSKIESRIRTKFLIK